MNPATSPGRPELAGRSGRPVRFAVVGCGNIARTHAAALARLRELGDVELAAFVDVLPERALALGAQHGGPARTWAETLADDAVDAVTICTPSWTHAELALAALAAGKHVVVEKPMDADLEAARRLRDAARASDRVLAVISQHRFDPATEDAARILAEGGLGTLVLVEARVPWWRPQSYYDADPWRGTLAGDGGGALINQAIHTVDLMLALAGPVASVQAIATTRVHRIEVEDVIVASLRFASGALGTLSATTASAPGFPARLSLAGDGGALAIEGDALVLDERADGSRGAVAVPRLDAVAVAAGGSRSVSGAGAGAAAGRASGTGLAWGDAHERQLADAVAAIRGGVAPRSGGGEGYAALELVDAIYRAAREGRAIDLAP
ncbi:putative dehydrogenase [Salana multivorans]|uniref:Putative dehydrogenase n=1 Tax=Salana multivorans TaxID=120377 RepID=A0A3N2DBV8_9MICO|nr:Gfo/Idh/MocA family oxidoreductase [Salana multivorans]ROR97285.1 putative dehydrogenase [Salana multivorans]